MEKKTSGHLTRKKNLFIFRFILGPMRISISYAVISFFVALIGHPVVYAAFASQSTNPRDKKLAALGLQPGILTKLGPGFLYNGSVEKE